eukprot:1630935-Prorocentrum_lima.AAC.1
MLGTRRVRQKHTLAIFSDLTATEWQSLSYRAALPLANLSRHVLQAGLWGAHAAVVAGEPDPALHRIAQD